MLRSSTTLGLLMAATLFVNLCNFYLLMMVYQEKRRFSTAFLRGGVKDPKVATIVVSSAAPHFEWWHEGDKSLIASHLPAAWMVERH